MEQLIALLFKTLRIHFCSDIGSCLWLTKKSSFHHMLTQNGPYFIMNNGNYNLLALESMEQGLDKNLGSITGSYRFVLLLPQYYSCLLSILGNDLLLIRNDDPVHPLPLSLHNRVLLVQLPRVRSVVVGVVGLLLFDIAEVVVVLVGVHGQVVVGSGIEINLLLDLHSS